jgi:hypothetical protein
MPLKANWRIVKTFTRNVWKTLLLRVTVMHISITLCKLTAVQILDPNLKWDLPIIITIHHAL